MGANAFNSDLRLSFIFSQIVNDFSRSVYCVRFSCVPFLVTYTNCRCHAQIYKDAHMKRSVSKKGNSFIFGNARFQWLTSRLVRLEWQENGCFEDRKTLTVVNRNFPSIPITQEGDDRDLI